MKSGLLNVGAKTGRALDRSTPGRALDRFAPLPPSCVFNRPCFQPLTLVAAVYSTGRPEKAQMGAANESKFEVKADALWGKGNSQFKAADGRPSSGQVTKGVENPPLRPPCLFDHPLRPL